MYRKEKKIGVDQAAGYRSRPKHSTAESQWAPLPGSRLTKLLVHSLPSHSHSSPQLQQPAFTASPSRVVLFFFFFVFFSLALHCSLLSLRPHRFSSQSKESKGAGAMVRGGSSGGGQSSLGYLFGSDAGPPKAVARAPAPEPQQAPAEQRAAGFARTNVAEEKCAAAAPAAPAAKVEESKVHLGRNSNNYHRADGQNTGNFITDRPSTKVHSAPGGGSSLGYLFGGD